MILEAQDDMNVVGEVGDGARGVEAARTLDSDFVLMDVSVPELDEIEATRRLVAAWLARAC
jgi:DNA-binding NarL/FixJ family response regulator